MPRRSTTRDALYLKVNFARRLRAAVLACLVLIALPGQGRAGSESGRLVRFVMVTRHGVRSPIPKGDELRKWSSEQWPDWPVGPGELTPRGKQLVTRLGGYYRELLRGEKLLPPTGCPDQASFFVWTDTDQRTRETGRGLLDGLAPGCGLEAHSSAQAVDPLFRSISAGVCPIDDALGRAAILGRAGGDLDTAVAADQDSMDALQAVMRCCQPVICGGAASCSLPKVGSRIQTGSDGSLWAGGGLSIASTASEIFLLEYTQGLPANQVGWGRIDAAGILAGLRLHTLFFDLMFRTPYLASHGGSLLMSHVLAALDPATRSTAAATDTAPSNAKFVAYVGHDTNVANVGAMLDATWQLPGYPANYTTPGGALTFELRRTSDGALKVYSSYVAQTLSQMRGIEALGLAHPPARSPLFIPGCSSAAPGYPCTLEGFERTARAALAPECPIKPRTVGAHH